MVAPASEPKFGYGQLDLAGVLLFAEHPKRFKPQFTLKAIRYPGTTIHETACLDTEDFAGLLPDIFGGALSFVMRNLHKIQAGRGVNAPGTPDIPRSVFEELLVNALVHRDYLFSAPIRLFMFDDRIEIINPGHDGIFQLQMGWGHLEAPLENSSQGNKGNRSNAIGKG